MRSALALAALLSLCPAAPALAAPPPNDDFNSATVLPSAKYAQTSGTTVGATDAYFPDEPDVWYTWMAPSSGPVKISLESATRAPQLEFYLDGTEYEFQTFSLEEPPDFPITDFSCEAPKRECNEYSVQAGNVYRIRAFTCCGDPKVPFTLRVLRDDVAPQTLIGRVRVNREQRFVRIFPRASDPEPRI